MVPDAGAALEGRIADLGRRIAEARADAQARPSTPRPFPKLLLAAVVLIVAIVAGGLALAARDGGGDGAADAGLQRAPASAGAPAAAPDRAAAPDQGVEADRAGEPAGTEGAGTAATAAAAPDGTAAVPAPVPDAPEVRTLTVAQGESFWSIAEREVATQLGRAPTDAEVTSWWASFVAANADRLVEPGNPNLLLTGQVLVAPGGG